MVDIPMCNGESVDGKACPKRNECYCFRAKPDSMQSYFQAPYQDGYCSYHIKTDGCTDLRTIEECEKPVQIFIYLKKHKN